MTAGRRFAVLALAGICSCERADAPPTDVAPGSCLADTIGRLTTRGTTRGGCPPEDLGCRDACRDGNAVSCYERAISLEKSDSTEGEAHLLHRRACELGLAIGCTNFAAGVWASSSSDADQACARRLFAKSCDAGDPFGCGMLGRAILDDERGADHIARGRDVLERACDRLRGFPCRVLAKHLESGQLGPVATGQIQSLLRRACAGGDDLACGDHATALETFSP
jgi:hypothetical protein